MAKFVLLSFIGELLGHVDFVGRDAEAFEALFIGNAVKEIFFHLGNGDSVVGSFGAGEAGLDFAQIQLKDIGEFDVIFGSVVSEEALTFEGFFDHLHSLGTSVGQSEIVERFGIGREVAHGCTVFGGHVGDGGSVGKTQGGDSGSEELNKFANDSSFSEGIGDLKDQIGGGDIFPQIAFESEPDNFRQDHGDGLTKHDSLSFDSSDSPSGNTQPVDHGGVRIGSDD